jgi:hypothetical protein
MKCSCEQNTWRNVWKCQAQLHRRSDIGAGSCIKHRKGKNTSTWHAVLVNVVNDLLLIEWYQMTLSLGALFRSPRGADFRSEVHLTQSWKFKSQLFWQMSQDGQRVVVGGGGWGGWRLGEKGWHREVSMNSSLFPKTTWRDSELLSVVFISCQKWHFSLVNKMM